MSEREREAPKDDERDDDRGEAGSGGSADVPPAAPADDDAPLGDTDQHSDADA